MPDPLAGEYLVGVVTTDITPAPGTPLAGFGNRGVHASTGVYHPLRAVAVAIDDGRTPVILVSAEWIGFYDRAPRVRAAIAAATGVPDARIVLSGTHTHCGPAIRERDKTTHGWIDESYLERAVSIITEAALRAWEVRHPATLSAGVGRSGMAMSRRALDPDRPGRVRRSLTPNPIGPTDPEVTVVQVASTPDGAPRAMLVSYGCHPTSRSTQKVGGDYVSYLYDDLEEAFPQAQPAFFQGCGGDQKVRPANPRSAEFIDRSLDGVRRAGASLADAVIDTVAHRQLRPVSGSVTAARAVIDLETEPVVETALRAALSPEEPAYRQRWARQHLDTLGRGEQPRTAVPFEIQTITFGDSLALIAMSGEMTAEHGLRLKRELRGRFDHVLPLGYANDIVGYVPVRRQFSEYGYEVLDANQYHGRTGRYVEETEDRIHAQIRQMLGV